MNNSKREKERRAMRELNPSVEFANKTGLAYGRACKPLCQQLHLPQTAFDILMFLANNPGYQTARDIVEVRHIKTTGRTILFKIILSNGENEIGSAEISYYVDEYGQIF